MIRRRRFSTRRFCFFITSVIIGLLIAILYISLSFILNTDEYLKDYYIEPDIKANLTRWNRSLCNDISDHRGPHQKIISISIYAPSSSKYTDNPMFSWKTILSLLTPLADEVKLLLPSWTIRVYVDFTSSSELQRELLHNFSNVDICDINNLPLFGSSLSTYLPGKMWRFLPVFDPFVDYMLSFDLDSPMTQRQTDTINMWISDEHKSKFFYIARDHFKHEVPILGGLWGAAMIRARDHLFYTFQPMLIPSIGRRYTGTGDQRFLWNYVWKKVKDYSLTFDSYFCGHYGGQPFPSQRPVDDCFLGCVRSCCSNTTNGNSRRQIRPCPVACRPKDHQDWTYC